MNKCEQLYERVASGNSDSTYDLLGCFEQGYPLDKLRRLITSDNPLVVKEATWIACELGQSAKPLAPYLGKMLRGKEVQTRFYAIDCVLLWTKSGEFEESIATAISLARDPEFAVRSQVTCFLAACSRAQLTVGANSVRDPEIEDELEWLVTVTDRADTTAVEQRLSETRPFALCFILAAALRIASHSPDTLLSFREHQDEDVREFIDIQLPQGRRWGFEPIA